MGAERSSTLGAFAELWCMPAVGCLAGAKAHFGCFAFRDSHRMVVWLVCQVLPKWRDTSSYQIAKMKRYRSQESGQGRSFLHPGRIGDARAEGDEYPP